MSTVIDNRVVDMQFNNAQFERGASQTISTLEKLKEGLRFKDGTKGMEEIQNGANRLNFNGIADALTITSNKFSLLEIAGITAFTNIVNKGVNLLESKIKELTIGQVTSGWNKYAEKTSAVQTIMAATAKDFDDTAEHMSYVNDQLSKLNWFTDETSFNFLDMVNNIGKFTANQIPLEQSVTAMEGISTWAAVSGANIGEAGRAMYNLSQAIAVGSVKLMDWKSIENANMATAEFKETVIQTALEMGTLEKKGDKVFVKGNKKALVSVKNFNAELSRGWFSSEVLLKSLDKYGAFTNKLYEFSDKTGLIASDILDIIDRYRDGSASILDIMKELGDTELTSKEVKKMLDGLTDSSMALGEKAFRAAQEAKTFQEAIDSVKDAVSTGWMQTFELIFGNYEQAKGLWTTVANELYDIFAESGNKRNELLEQWNELGGRDILIESMSNAWNGFRNILDLVGESFRNIFPETTVDDLMNFTKKLNEATETFLNFVKVRDKKPTEVNKDSKGLKRINAGGNTFSDGFEAENKQIDATQRRLENISKTFEGFFALIDIIANVLGTIANAIGRFVGYIIPAADGVAGMTGSLGEWLVTLDEALKQGDYFNKFLTEIDPLLQAVATVIKKAVDFISNSLNSLLNILHISVDSTEEMGDKLEKTFSPFKTLADIINKSMTAISNGWKTALPILGSGLKMIGDKIKFFFDTFKKGMKSGSFGDFMNILKTGMLAVFLRKITVAVNNLTGVKSRIVDFFEGLIKSLNPVSESSSGDDILKLAGAIGILALSLTLISGIDPKIMWSSIAAIAALAKIIESVYKTINEVKKGGVFEDLEGIFVDFSKNVTNSIKKTFKNFNLVTIAVALVLFAAAIATLTGALVNLSALSWEGILKGLAGIAALIAMLLITTKILSKMKGKLVEGIGALAGFAMAVKQLSDAVVTLSALDQEGLMRGVGAVSILILALTLFARYSKDVKLLTGGAILLLAVALNVIVKAVSSLGALDEKAVSQGLSAIAGIFLALTSFMVLVSKYTKSGKMMAGAVSVLLISTALVIISKAVKNLSEINPDQLNNAIGAITALLLAMGALTVIMKGGLGNSATIISLAIGIIAIAGALKLVSSIPMENMNTALYGLTWVISVMTLASNFAKAGGSAAILLLSTSLLILSVAFKVMSTISIDGVVSAIVAFVGALILMTVASVALTPGMAASFLSTALSITLFGAGLLMAAVGISTFTTSIGMLMGALKILAVNAKAMAILGVIIILEFINGVVSMLPAIVETAVYTIVVFLYTVAVAIQDHAPAIVGAVFAVIQAIWALVIEAIAGLLELIPGVGGGLAEKVRGWKPNIDAAATEAFKDVPDAAKNSMAQTEKAASSGADSFTSTIMSNGQEYKGAGSYMAGMVGDGAMDLGELMKKAGVEGWEQYCGVLVNPGAAKANEAGKEIKDETIEGLGNEEGFAETGEMNMRGYIRGMKRKQAEAQEVAARIASGTVRSMRATLDQHSPSKVMDAIGVNNVLGYVGGMLRKAKLAAKAGGKIADASLTGISKAIQSASDIFSQEVDTTPVISPVINLDDIQQGVGVLDGLLNNRSYSFAADARVRFDRNRMAEMEQQIAESSALNDALKSVNDKLEQFNNSGNYHFETPVVLNGREIARGTAEFTREELNKLDRLNNRKGGRV